MDLINLIKRKKDIYIYNISVDVNTSTSIFVYISKGYQARLIIITMQEGSNMSPLSFAFLSSLYFGMLFFCY